MSREEQPRSSATPERGRVLLTGAVNLSEERLNQLDPLWKAVHATLRRMDELDVTGWEPATIFAWRGEQR